MMGKSIFGSLFDFNGDGKMSAFERAAELVFIHDVVMADEADDELPAAGRDRDELSWMDEDERTEALEDAGLDRDELSWMDEDERRAVLEEAGLDPFDFDDDF